MNRKEIIIDNSKWQFHKTIQPIDRESQQKKMEQFKKDMEERSKENLKRK